MRFRRKTRTQRLAAALRHAIPTRRTVAKVAGGAGVAVGVAAGSTGLSALRQKQA